MSFATKKFPLKWDFRPGIIFLGEIGAFYTNEELLMDYSRYKEVGNKEQ